MIEDGKTRFPHAGSVFSFSAVQLFLNDRLDLGEILIAQQRQRLHELLGRKVRPPPAKEQLDELLVEAVFDKFGGVSAVDGVGRYVLHNDRVGRDDRTVADLDAGHDDALVPDPHVVSEHDITLTR